MPPSPAMREAGRPLISKVLIGLEAAFTSLGVIDARLALTSQRGVSCNFAVLSSLDVDAEAAGRPLLDRDALRTWARGAFDRVRAERAGQPAQAAA